MTTPLQRAYLDAMGIPVWMARRGERPEQSRGSEAALLQLGPGNGPVLLLCDSVDGPAAPLATDVARTIGSGPVWGWPSTADAGMPAAEAVAEGLFTHVLVLGEKAGKSLFGGRVPDQLGAAVVLELGSLEELAASAAARRALWKALADQGLARRPATAGKGVDLR